MDSRVMLKIVKGKKLECALVELDNQIDIENEESDRKARELEWVLHGGKYPE